MDIPILAIVGAVKNEGSSADRVKMAQIIEIVYVYLRVCVALLQENNMDGRTIASNAATNQPPSEVNYLPEALEPFCCVVTIKDELTITL